MPEGQTVAAMRCRGGGWGDQGETLFALAQTRIRSGAVDAEVRVPTGRRGFQKEIRRCICDSDRASVSRNGEMGRERERRRYK